MGERICKVTIMIFCAIILTGKREAQALSQSNLVLQLKVILPPHYFSATALIGVKGVKVV